MDIGSLRSSCHLDQFNSNLEKLVALTFIFGLSIDGDTVVHWTGHVIGTFAA